MKLLGINTLLFLLIACLLVSMIACDTDCIKATNLKGNTPATAPTVGHG